MTASSKTPARATHAPRHRAKAIAAAAIGNGLELFDLTVFGFFAAVIGAQFFPSDNPTLSLLGSFATFALGFLMRPAGALLLAPLGDRLGRKQLLSLTMALMGCASLVIALLPNYATIGLAAPLLLVLMRLIQGFAAGGEWGGAVSMMVEHASAKRRGLVGSLQQVGFGVGILAGTACAFVLNNLLTADALQAWGWRVPFVLGAAVAPLALYIRRNVDESPAFASLAARGEQARAPLAETFTQHRAGVLCVIGLGTAGTAAGYISSQFMSSYATLHLGLPAKSVSAVILSASILQAVLIPFWGWVSDKVGRVPVVGGAALAYLVLAVPMFQLLASSPSLAHLSLVTLACAVLVAASFGPLPAMVSEFFPAHIRTTAVSVGYNFAAAVFGGSAPLASTWLITATGQLAAPAYYAVGCALVSTCTAIHLMRRPPRVFSVPMEAQ